MTRGPVLFLLFLAQPACVRFDDYPVGDLCEDAERDEEGRATRYPEWRICEPTSGGQGGATSIERKGNLGGSTRAL